MKNSHFLYAIMLVLFSSTNFTIYIYDSSAKFNLCIGIFIALTTVVLSISYASRVIIEKLKK